MADVKPNFLVVGAAKTGTTSLYDYLRQHPQVFLPTKETFFFQSEVYRDNHLPYPAQRPKAEIVFDEAQFLRAYEGAGAFAARGEVATGYLYYWRESIPRIKALLGEDVRLMAVLRQPVERLYSGYTFFTRDLHEKLSLEEALAAEPERRAAGWDFMWHYTEHSKYAEGVRAYQQAFPHFKVLFFDDLQADPAAFMREVFGFLGVQQDVPLNLEMKNVSGAPKSKAFQHLITQENPVKRALRPVLRAAFGRETRHRMRSWLKARNVGDKDRLSTEQYNALLPRFEEDIRELERLTGRDLSGWRARR
jgi:hypothetical protein